MTTRWLPVQQIYQGHCFEPDADPTQPDFNPLAEVRMISRSGW